MRVLTSPSADDLRRLRHTVAAAIERVRALELAPGDAAIAGEVACIALGALSTALFVGSESTGHSVPAGLVEDEIHRIVGLLGLDPQAASQQPDGCVCLSGGLPPEPSTVAP